MDVQDQIPPVVEQPVIETPPPADDVIAGSASIADHAAKFGPNAKEPEPETQEAKDAAAKAHHSAQQRREKETGQFRDGKVRHRAQSQKATAEDAPRIQALTGRAKAAEERAERAERELAQLRTAGASAPQIAKAEAKVAAAGGDTSDPEPTEAEFDDYSQYLRAVAKWEGRHAYHQERQQEQTKAAEAKRQTEDREALQSWRGRVESARARYEDFDAIAFEAESKIPAGSALDAWIMEHRAGPDVLYYFQSHQQELDSLLVKPVLEQVEDLALLSQRLLPTSTSPAGTTGSVASRPTSIVLPPRPPNPVRTEAQRAGDHPPPLDGSLSIAEHAKAFGPKRR